MKFGDYLRQQREQKNWTQPDAAQKIDIEQSYLSKLETGKSYPSEDIFTRLAELYNIDTSDLIRKVFSSELDKLREIQQIRAIVLAQQKTKHTLTRSWLLAGLLCLMLGGACLGVSIIDQGARQEFYYRSAGILKPGDPLTAFNIIKHEIPNQENMAAGYKDMLTRQLKMIARLKQKDLVTTTYRDTSFVEDVEGGRRYYELFEDREREQPSLLRWFIVPAIMFLLSSFGSFFISTRWT